MGCLNHLGPWFGGLPVRLRQLPSKPSSNQSWVPGPFDAQNSCHPNVFCFFFRDKGLWSYPFYTRIVRSFMYMRKFPHAWDDRRLFQTLPLHCPSDFETPDQFLWFFHRFFTGRDDDTPHLSKGLTRGGGMTLSVDLIEVMYPWTQLWHMVSWELGTCLFARPRCSMYGGCICLTFIYPQKPSKCR